VGYETEGDSDVDWGPEDEGQDGVGNGVGAVRMDLKGWRSTGSGGERGCDVGILEGCERGRVPVRDHGRYRGRSADVTGRQEGSGWT
jgi:hypothetical protein